MFEVMKTVSLDFKQKNNKPTKSPSDKEQRDDGETPPEAGSFAQTGREKDVVCHICGKPGEYSTDCPLKKLIAEVNWFKNSESSIIRPEAREERPIHKSVAHALGRMKLKLKGSAVRK